MDNNSCVWTRGQLTVITCETSELQLKCVDGWAVQITNVSGLENFYYYSYLGQIDYLLEFISQIRLPI